MYPRMEREFDRMIKKATPYLIFSPNDVRDVVADYMKSLWRAMRNNNTNDFDILCTNINRVIATSDDLIDGTLQIDISDFDGRWSNLDESISNLRMELRDLKKEVSNINKEVNLAEVNLAEVNLAEANLAEANSPKKRKPHICSCGKNLSRSKNKNGIYTYHCYKSKGGCGKIYSTNDGGQLIEKSTVIQNKIFCTSCDGILNRQGKVKSNDKEYQIYACKSPANGGCGKGYVMDDDGDLHLGRRESALLRPKIQQ